MARTGTSQRDFEEQLASARDDAAEAAVLAACLLLGSSDTKPPLSDGDFVSPARRTIWKAMRNLKRRKRTLDATMLGGAIQDMGLWGTAEDSVEHVSAGDLLALFRLLPHGLSRDHYAERVREMTQRRAMLLRESKYNGRG
jgi:replicative DNA helicase